MATAIPAGLMIVDERVFYALIILCIFSTFITLFLVTFLKSKIPEAVSLMKAELYKRPWVHVHTSLNQLAMFAPKRSGKDTDENCYDMSKYLGLKIVPDPESVEHSDASGRRVIHYYSKAAPAITAKQSAACRDVIKHLKLRGIKTTESLVDALFIATDKELEEWYANEPDMLELIKTLKIELQNKFIHDGQFVWETVKDFIFAASNETSRSLDEFKSIAHEQADERVRAVTNGSDAKQTLMYGVIILFSLAIAYKIGFT